MKASALERLKNAEYALKGDFRIVENALKEARWQLEADGGKRTWLDAPIAIAEQNSKGFPATAPCPFQVGDLIKDIQTGAIARVTGLTQRGFIYDYLSPQTISPRLGLTFLGGECYCDTGLPIQFERWDREKELSSHKWFDPECYDGCSSLKFKNEIDYLTKEIEKLRKLAHIAEESARHFKAAMQQKSG
jgi:hypothetical protein